MDRALSLKAWTLPAARSRASLPVWRGSSFFGRDLHEDTHLLCSHVAAVSVQLLVLLSNPHFLHILLFVHQLTIQLDFICFTPTETHHSSQMWREL